MVHYHLTGVSKLYKNHGESRWFKALYNNAGQPQQWALVAPLARNVNFTKAAIPRNDWYRAGLPTVNFASLFADFSTSSLRCLWLLKAAFRRRFWQNLNITKSHFFVFLLRFSCIYAKLTTLVKRKRLNGLWTLNWFVE